MGLIGTLDATPDALSVWDATETVTAASTQASAIIDLGPAWAQSGMGSGELLCARFSFSTLSTTANDMVIVNVQGGNDATFATGDVYNLGTLAVGAVTITNTNIGVSQTVDRGRGDYLLPFYNVGIQGDVSASPSTQKMQACRYVRIQTKTIGASSGCTFSVRIQKL